MSPDDFRAMIAKQRRLIDNDVPLRPSESVEYISAAEYAERFSAPPCADGHDYQNDDDYTGNMICSRCGEHQ